ncbi:hypothetical protein BGZ98_008939 [Dissophora globulifera]|nr:hypothetical protein BGZ98_008939 [Dissophora globulifera]
MSDNINPRANESSPSSTVGETDQTRTSKKALIEYLEELKLSAEGLEREDEEEKHTLRQEEERYKKEEEEVRGKIEAAKVARQKLSTTVADLESEIQEQEDMLLDLINKRRSKKAQLEDKEKDFQDYEDALCKDLGGLDPPEETEKAKALRDEVERTMEKLGAFVDNVDEQGEGTDDTAVDTFQQRLDKDEAYIRDLEFMLDPTAIDNDAVAMCSSISEEFELLKIRLRLIKGSDMQKQVGGWQAQLVKEYDEGISAMMQQHRSKLEQIHKSDREHKQRLQAAISSTEEAKARLASADEALKVTGEERASVRAKSDALQKQIEDLQHQLTQL